MKKHLDTSLRLRLWLYFGILVFELGLACYHVLADDVFVVYPLVSLVIGIMAGIWVSKALHVSWDRGAKRVITRWDEYAVGILVLSAVLEYFKDNIVEYFINGPSVAAVGFALIAGAMFGRVVGMSGKISELVERHT